MVLLMFFTCSMINASYVVAWENAVQTVNYLGTVDK